MFLKFCQKKNHDTLITLIRFNKKWGVVDSFLAWTRFLMGKKILAPIRMWWVTQALSTYLHFIDFCTKRRYDWVLFPKSVKDIGIFLSRHFSTLLVHGILNNSNNIQFSNAQHDSWKIESYRGKLTFLLKDFPLSKWRRLQIFRTDCSHLNQTLHFNSTQYIASVLQIGLSRQRGRHKTLET